MKTKTLLSYIMLLCILISCAGEDAYLKTSNDSLKTYELQSFENSMKRLGSPENRSSLKEFSGGKKGIELSEKRQLILLESAKTFLISEGVTEEYLETISIKEIIVLALQTRSKKLSEISRINNNYIN